MSATLAIIELQRENAALRARVTELEAAAPSEPVAELWAVTHQGQPVPHLCFSTESEARQWRVKFTETPSLYDGIVPLYTRPAPREGVTEAAILALQLIAVLPHSSDGAIEAIGTAEHILNVFSEEIAALAVSP